MTGRLVGRAPHRYNSAMRRSLRLGLAIAVVLLVAACGAYTLYWFIAARRLEDGLGRWVRSLHAHELDVSWRTSRVAGFPFGFRLELTDLRVRDRSPVLPGEIRLPALSASPAPFDYRVWRLAAPDGLSAATGAARLTARAASGTLLVSDKGGAKLWFDLGAPAGGVGVRIAARRAVFWVILPPRPPQTHTEPAIQLAFDAHDLSLPQAPAPFRNPLDELSAGLTLRGFIPSKPLRQAAEAWRAAGGSIDIEHVALRWDGLSVTGSGTAALDDDLQPVGAFSGAIEGYDRLMAALVADGRIRPGEAKLAQLALGFLSRTGPDGHPQISTSFTIQQGQMYLGPAHIGPAPHLDWR